MKTIFVVDDSDTNLLLVETALEKHYNVMTMSSAAGLFFLIGKLKPDMIILDIEMPEMDGFTAFEKLKSMGEFADIPVIFLTGRTDEEIESRGFEMGVVDFITKPFSPSVLLNRIKSHLDIDELIRERTMQLQKLQTNTISVMADMIENRDKGTGDHIERTSIYLRILIEGMFSNDIYTDEIKSWNTDNVISSARMHDLGKITIPDIIINKPGKLSSDEFEIMKTHAIEGEKIIDEMISRIDEDDFLHNAKIFAGCHHERWDGRGYPRGLKEDRIPLQGRIMAIADVYDALVSVRPYKNAFPVEEAVQIIMDGSGTQFDPLITEVFRKVIHLFRETRNFFK